MVFIITSTCKKELFITEPHSTPATFRLVRCHVTFDCLLASVLEGGAGVEVVVSVPDSVVWDLFGLVA